MPRKRRWIQTDDESESEEEEMQTENEEAPTTADHIDRKRKHDLSSTLPLEEVEDVKRPRIYVIEVMNNLSTAIWRKLGHQLRCLQENLGFPE